MSTSGDIKNKRWYEVDNAFRSQVLTVTDIPTVLWSLTTSPARTAGRRTDIYVISVHSAPGNTIGEVAIEQPVNIQLFPRISLSPAETAVVCLETPIPVGTTGVYARAYRGGTLEGMEVQILGLEV